MHKQLHKFFGMHNKQSRHPHATLHKHKTIEMMQITQHNTTPIITKIALISMRRIKFLFYLKKTSFVIYQKTSIKD